MSKYHSIFLLPLDYVLVVHDKCSHKIWTGYQHCLRCVFFITFIYPGKFNDKLAVTR